MRSSGRIFFAFAVRDDACELCDGLASARAKHSRNRETVSETNRNKRVISEKFPKSASDQVICQALKER